MSLPANAQIRSLSKTIKENENVPIRQLEVQKEMRDELKKMQELLAKQADALNATNAELAKLTSALNQIITRAQESSSPQSNR